MASKKDRLGGRYGGEPEKAIADPGNLDVPNPVEEASQHGLHQYKSSNKRMTKALKWAGRHQIPRHKDYAKDWIRYRTKQTPYRPNGEHISNRMKAFIRAEADKLLLGEQYMKNLTDLVNELVTEAPGDEKEPNWAKIYRRNIYDRCEESVKHLEELMELTGRRPKPGTSWELDEFKIEDLVHKIQAVEFKARLNVKSLKSYITALGKSNRSAGSANRR